MATKSSKPAENIKDEVTDTASIEESKAVEPKSKASAKASKAPTGKTWAYIGPTIPRTRLVENAIITGTRAGVEDYLADELEKYPEAKNLIVEIGSLAEGRVKVKSPGNYLGKLYADIVSKNKT